MCQCLPILGVISALDFYTLSTYEDFFVVIDEYSRYPEIHRVGPHRLEARYDTLTITKKKGSMITATRHNNEVASPFERIIPDGDFRVDVVLETSRSYARNHFFTTDKQLHLLRKAKRWYGDGTFFICPTPFYLVFGIHAFIRHGHLDKESV
ncbi:hypothetical protein DAPPUDRAFT_329209 [Daphnia pulex]|uniref:Uncharacterized protein n=1 Tax=Daphnia pulex TaxID=6669 RepID=E9HFZ0_DAPPU|nr:hypothetical protein DAPPUDRAFT_329209 [Daphnia pulex]|eukprot:EFX69350.1 hypothetical protein DAPPUDRAFT_329209 [Daphnia pulex]